MQWFIDGLDWLYGLLKTLLGWMLDGGVYVIKSTVWFFADGILSFLSGVIGAIDYSAVVLNWAGAWAGVPSTMLYLLSAIGFPQFVTIIASAYALRFAMNLIPSVAGFSLDKL